MNKKIKAILFTTLSALTLTTTICITTSCSNNFAINNNLEKIVIEYNAQNTLLQSYTYQDWAYKLQNKQIEEFISAINSIDNQYKNSQFIIDQNTSISVVPVDSSTSDVYYVNANFYFLNNNKEMLIKIKNLYFVPPTNITKPDLELVSTPVIINQIDLPVIYNTNPTLILDSEWTYYINLLSPGNTLYIPNDLYYIKSRSLLGDKKYKLEYVINPQYLNMINPDDFPNLIFEINISPNIDKIPCENFELTKDDTQNIFPSFGFDNFDLQNDIEIYNNLSKYVDNIGIYESLVNCIDELNNKIYNFQLFKLEISKTIIISFTSNPNNENSKIYFYNFTLKFN